MTAVDRPGALREGRLFFLIYDKDSGRGSRPNVASPLETEMVALHLHLPTRSPHVTWRQIEYGLLATMSVGGVVLALLLALVAACL